MEDNLLSLLVVGFILGIKHALEPDHVIAVSTIASHSKKLWRSSLAGMFWGVGHMTTLFTIGIILIFMKNQIPERWAMSLEFIVGIMLVYLGVSSIFSFGKKAVHVHKHENFSYVKSMLIGLIHGIAGSAAMVLLTVSTVKTVWEGVLYILIFGMGTIMGMLFFTTIIGIPFVLTAKQKSINNVLTQITAIISTAYGFYYMYNLGITEGLFKIWIQF
jgi:high-affinity nickel permease